MQKPDAEGNKYIVMIKKISDTNKTENMKSKVSFL